MKITKKTERKDQQGEDDSLTFQNGILRWKLKEGRWYTSDLIAEELNNQRLISGNRSHVLLLNATDNAVINLECTDLILSAPKRKAVAIVTGENLASHIMVNFYINKSNFKKTARLFKTETSALAWLQEQLVKEEDAGNRIRKDCAE